MTDHKLQLADLEKALTAWTLSGDGVGPEWDPYRSAIFALPDWYDHSLDPSGCAYRAQQLRLWSIISGRDTYDPQLNEQADEIAHFDAVRHPGFFARRDFQAIKVAAEHIIATGHILARSDLKPGDNVIEYGAGFGQTALTLSRLGVRVDTVDINAHFCHSVQVQAEAFSADLHAFHGLFGFRPDINRLYNLILFYEAFHHCLDFSGLVQCFEEMLADDGKVILCGEPIFDRAEDALPYPWGIRLDAANVVVIRHRGWLELGFCKSFLDQIFSKNGFLSEEFHLPGFHYSRLLLFRRTPNRDAGS